MISKFDILNHWYRLVTDTADVMIRNRDKLILLITSMIFFMLFIILCKNLASQTDMTKNNEWILNHMTKQPKQIGIKDHQERYAYISIPPTISKIVKTEKAEKIPTVSMWQHTSIIGNDTQPTIDGGIINAADGIPVYQPPQYPKETLHNSNTLKSDTSANNVQNSKSFVDDWATSSKVKSILEYASQTGKLAYVLRQSEAKKLPATVALVPVIESAYHDDAISPKGATGSWQLMPLTAEAEGIDLQQRTEFIPSTDVALNLLSQLHQQFGNWDLAYAAYNVGSKRLSIALHQNPSARSIDDLNLPQETKNYVHAIQNISIALCNNYGVT